MLAPSHMVVEQRVFAFLTAKVEFQHGKKVLAILSACLLFAKANSLVLQCRKKPTYLARATFQDQYFY